MKYIRFLIREFRHNLSKVFESLRKHRFLTTLSLILVKLMDYSDHMPSWLLSEIKLNSFRLRDPGSLRFAKSEQLLWAGDFELSVSYIASRGEKESHPHQTFISYSSGQQKLFYCDYEGNIWKSAPLRAASFSVASISFGSTGEIIESAYCRTKMPKSASLCRQQIYALGKEIIAALYNKHLHQPKLVTFACVEQPSAGLQLIACRFCNILPEFFGGLLVRAEHKIVKGIYREMTDQLNLIADLSHQQAFREFIFSSERKVFRGILGNKQLSIRRSSECNQ